MYLSVQLLCVTATRTIDRSDTIHIRRKDVACQLAAFGLRLTSRHMVKQLGKQAGMQIMWMR